MYMAKRPEYPTLMRLYREAKEMTLQDVEAYLDEIGLDVGHSHAQLGRIERGLQPYNEELLKALAKLYDAPVEALVSRDPNLAALLRHWAKVDDNKKKDIEEYAEYVFGKSKAD